MTSFRSILGLLEKLSVTKKSGTRRRDLTDGKDGELVFNPFPKICRMLFYDSLEEMDTKRGKR